MRIISYGVIDSSDRIKSHIAIPRGIRIYNIPYRDIGMIISDPVRPSGKSNNGNNPEYKNVVEHLMKKFTVLPVRSRIPLHKKDILPLMENHYYEFRNNLDRVRNKVEFQVKIVWKEDEVKEWINREYERGIYGKLKAYGSKGVKFIDDVFEKYLIEKEFSDMADIFVEIVDNFLGTFASEKRLEKLKGENILLKAFYLVDKRKQNDFKEAFDVLRIAPGNLDYTLRGPLPPFDFVEIEGMDKPISQIKHND